jgi:hypothetical protein
MRHRVERVKLRQSAAALRSLSVGATAFLLGIGADRLSRILPRPWGFLDDILLSILAGLIVLWYERLKMRDLRKRLIITRQMNHSVREGLQTVVCAAEVQKDQLLSTIVRNSLDRIDWALKEVLTEIQ